MRNVNSKFAMNPATVDIERSTFNQHWTHLTTANAGKLIPVSVLEVLPGDTFSMDTGVLARMATPIFPVMDDAYIDIYHFFVPNRLVWDHWKNLMGENTESAWVSDIDYEVPQFTYTTQTGGNKFKTNIDYFGLPVGKRWNSSTGSYADALERISVNALPFRGLRLIWNEWFRDQNVSDPKFINLGDSETDATLADLYPVAKYHDYFTSVLPAPQKGPSVPLPITGMAPVIPYGTGTPNRGDALRVHFSDNGYQQRVMTAGTIGGVNTNMPVYGREPSDVLGENSYGYVDGSNLYADLGEINIGTINQLRQAFQVQKLYERDARGGTRYIESIRSHFGVISPDARMQRPEYLGGERININMTQVAQTSGTGSSDTPQGNVSAYSLTRSRQNSYTKSFTEHGFVFCLCCIRTHQSYSQGINRMWSRKHRLDYYYPVFANLGEQAVLNKEIYATGDTSLNIDDEVFGYQEAWAEYRYTPSTISGAFRSNYDGGSLDSWHYGNDFRSLPTYSEEFIYENGNNVDRTLAVDEDLAPQFLLHFAFNNKATRKMPMYSIPGLIDHH